MCSSKHQLKALFIVEQSIIKSLSFIQPEPIADTQARVESATLIVHYRLRTT